MTPTNQNRIASLGNGLNLGKSRRQAGPNDVRGSIEAAARPKLLVSVRSPDEIRSVLTAGVDIVDLKEPRRGALSPTDVPLWHDAASLVPRGSRCPNRSGSPADQDPAGHLPLLSAALGEGLEALQVASQLPAEFAFAKVGPSHCDSLTQIRDLWSQVDQLLDDRTELVAVAYADFRSAGCLHPECIVESAIESGFRRCLIDTYSKNGSSTLDHLGTQGLKQLSDAARTAGLWWALAGSIRVNEVQELWSSGVRPDCFAVRGDVCERGRRTEKLSSKRISCWKESLASMADEGFTRGC